MTDCDRALELISAQLDGPLAAADAAWLEAHVAACPDCLRIAAVCPEDGSIEAFYHASLPWLGIFWHPEREKTPCATDLAILYNLFANA